MSNQEAKATADAVSEPETTESNEMAVNIGPKLETADVAEIIKNAHMQIKAVKEPTELMKVAEMTFRLLEKIWERI